MADTLTPIVLAVLAVIAAIVLMAFVYARNYIKVPPNVVAVFTGRGTFKVVKGGAKFKIPVLERVDFMKLEPFNVEVRVERIYDRNAVPVNVNAVGVVKFGSDDKEIGTAVERFLTTPRDEIRRQVQEILAGNMRGIVARMTIQDLNNKREEFRKAVVEEAGGDFANLGMRLDVLTVQNIFDENGYLDALGQGQIAEVRRDAQIRQANAERDAMIQAAAATREGKTAQALADTAVAEAERDRDLEMAKNLAQVEAEQARAAQAGPRAQAEAREAVLVAAARAEQAETEARIEVERRRAVRTREAQQADVVVPAEAARQGAVLEAQGRRDAEIAAAEADAKRRELAGAADAQVRTALADALRAEGEAEADREKVRLLAEAEGQRELASALNAYTEAAARLNVLPQIIEALPKVAREVAAPVGQISKFVVLDQGNGHGGIDRVADAVPALLLKTVEAMRAGGIDLSGLLSGVLAGNGHDESLEPAAAVAPEVADRPHGDGPAVTTRTSDPQPHD